MVYNRHLLRVSYFVINNYYMRIFSARQHAERAICYRPSVRPSVCLSVCLSVCPSVTRVDQSKTVERIIEILLPSDRPNILHRVRKKRNQ